ncbi:MAG: hypothetical protein ACF8OB_16525 [Phycisphaeraceae bacterium JB051]
MLLAQALPQTIEIITPTPIWQITLTIASCLASIAAAYAALSSAKSSKLIARLSDQEYSEDRTQRLEISSIYLRFLPTKERLGTKLSQGLSVAVVNIKKTPCTFIGYKFKSKHIQSNPMNPDLKSVDSEPLVFFKNMGSLLTFPLDSLIDQLRDTAKENPDRKLANLEKSCVLELYYSDGNTQPLQLPTKIVKFIEKLISVDPSKIDDDFCNDSAGYTPSKFRIGTINPKFIFNAPHKW